jgi:hypothetical protein
MPHYCQTIFFSLCVVFLTACKTIDAPKPVAHEKTLDYSPALSFVQLPVSIPLSSINDLINKKMGGLVYEDRSYTQPTVDDYQLIVMRKSSVTSVFDGKEIRITIPLNIWAKAQWKACSICPGLEKETTFDIDIYVRSKPELKNDYSFRLNLKSDGFDWKKKPVISLGIVDIPIERLLQKPLEIQLEKTIRDVEKEIASSFDLRSEISRLWNDCQEPNLIDADTETWLKIEPQQLFTTGLSEQSGSITMVLGASAYVGTVSGSRPLNSKLSALPGLQLVQKLPDDFRVQVQSRISFEALTLQVKKALVGQEFAQGKKQIKIEDIALTPIANRLLIQVVFSGSAKGSIFLSGIPSYDALKGVLYFKELDLDIESRSLLLKSASWLLNTTLQNTLEKQLRYPVSDYLNSVKNELDQKIKSFGRNSAYQLTGTIDSFLLQGIYMRETDLQLVLNANGKIRLQIQKFDF